MLKGFLNKVGIAPDQYAFYDGSGLSRQNLVTPHSVVQLLLYASAQPWGANFRSTLPVAGIDGSLSDRFRNTDGAGRVSAKTGSLGGVKSLSGYATTDRGETVAFSIITNNFNLPDKRVTDAIDDVVEAILHDGPAKKSRKNNCRQLAANKLCHPERSMSLAKQAHAQSKDPMQPNPAQTHQGILCTQPRPPRMNYSGIFPCFFGGFLSRFVSSISKARINFPRVSRGRITASTNPRSAAT